jgi:hypothetical protein
VRVHYMEVDGMCGLGNCVGHNRRYEPTEPTRTILCVDVVMWVCSGALTVCVGNGCDWLECMVLWCNG